MKGIQGGNYDFSGFYEFLRTLKPVKVSAKLSPNYCSLSESGGTATTGVSYAP